MCACVCTAGQEVNYISDFESHFKNSESHWLRNNVPVSIYIIGYQVAEREMFPLCLSGCCSLSIPFCALDWVAHLLANAANN